MMPSTVPAPLQAFVADELLRAPMVIDQVIEAAAGRVQDALPGMGPHERAVAGELMLALRSHRQRLADRYVAALRELIEGDRPRAVASSWAAPRAPSPPGEASRLSLVDDEEVAADIEISNTIEAIRSTAEYEMRELQTFVSALVGDMDVTRDHNPLRAETHARALWACAQALPMSRAWQLAFMRHAALPLAQVLRKSFASASSRLEQQGIEPAAHRTLVLPAGSRRSRWTGETTFSPDLGRMRESMPVGTAATVEPAPRRDASPPRELPRELQQGARTPADQQSLELLTRLFAAVLEDRELPPALRPLLERLQTPLMRLALREPGALDQDTHPAWRFVERLAFVGGLLPAAAEGADLVALERLIAPLTHETQPTTALFEAAAQRLAQLEQQQLEGRLRAASAQIAELQSREDRLLAAGPPPSTLAGTLDLAHMDTVPAELLEAAEARREPPRSAHEWIADLQPGGWCRLFLQGQWVQAQLLWPGDRGELFLFGDAAQDRTWAVRRNALATLHAERLADSLAPRRLVREAAKRVMRRLLRT